MSNSFTTPWTIVGRLRCPWDSPGRNNGAGCHSLLQGIFPIQWLKLCLLCLLPWQADSLPLIPGKPGKSSTSNLMFSQHQTSPFRFLSWVLIWMMKLNKRAVGREMMVDLHECIGLSVSLSYVTPIENVRGHLCLGVLWERSWEGFIGQISTEHQPQRCLWLEVLEYSRLAVALRFPYVTVNLHQGLVSVILYKLWCTFLIFTLILHHIANTRMHFRCKRLQQYKITPSKTKASAWPSPRPPGSSFHIPSSLYLEHRHIRTNM